jgi:eukaryotic-like serine/threonine-protein kinase
MTIAIGTKLGPCEITGAIGAGGMGEVYRAHDTSLGRDVAIKVLPDSFARDAERLARFQREAKVLAALNHANIASIYGLEDSGSTHALVMELAEGPTLADRVKQGPIPIEEALPIAKQIADALEYAHEKGIIHRDLKPANVKVSADDTVKILDFGLAKAVEGEASEMDIANSPTLTRMATQAGVLLGTAAYMSPEQAKAKPVDRRADIWAFGCVLYEMLTGKVAFHGETVGDTLAAVIKEEPNWSLLPSTTPARVRVLLQRCLQKEPKQRLQAIGEARITLDEVLAGVPDPIPTVATAPAAKSRLWWLVSSAAGLFLVLGLVLGFLYFHRKPVAAQTMRFEIPLPAKFTQEGDFALSPDGRKLAFIDTSADGQSRVWIRSIDSLQAEPLEGTDGAGGWPFWSSDSRFVAFGAEGKLKKVDVSGGPPVMLCDATTVFGGAWTPDDEIVFGSLTGLMQVPGAGGSASALTTDGPAVAPSLLPDGRHFIFLYASNQRSGGGIYVGSIDAPGEKSSKKLLSDLSTAVYAPSPGGTPGYVLFTRGAAAANESGTLMVQRFDARRLKLIGEAVPIAEQVSNTGFSASSTDALVYEAGALSVATGGSRGNIQGRLTWFDREGKALDAFGDSGLYRTFALSPDGKRVAFERADPQNPSNRNIWLYDFARGVTTRFTFDSGWDSGPIWSPDGTRIAFGRNIGNGNWDLYEKASNLIGGAELLFKSPASKIPTSWSPDGRFLLFQNPGAPGQVWILPLGGSAADRKPVAMEHSKFVESYGKFSPDGRWIAYTSDESGKSQIYVQPFNAPASLGSSSAGRTPITGKWMISNEGGTTPLWERDGKELFYLSLDGEAMAVDVNTSGIFQAGVPKPLFKTPPGVLFWDISPDGKRFLMVAPSNTAAASAPAKFTVVLNWQNMLKQSQ